TYVHLYEQYQPCIIYLARIKKLMEELGLDSPNEIKVLERIESNIQSNDSLQNIVEEFHRNYDKNFAVKENEKTALLVLSGFYIEGLYLISEIYIDNLSVKRLSRMMKNSFDNMILQQQVLLANMIELLNQYDDIDTRKLISQLSLIQKEFSDMQITYTQDEKTKKIKNIKYNTDEISSLNDVVKKIRQTII
ncbi:MAG: hypothetical protein HY738_08665, partial [Bacteroidia bacterium]|nr:hypothetical protein [Bacteroidia bacterium]